MKDHNLDNIDKLAKKAFEDFEVPYEPMDWAAFQHQLKAEGSIDQVAKDALETYQVDLPANSWERFEALLHQKNQNARYIWWFKAAEMGAIALLLLGLSQWLPCSDHSSNLVYDPTSTPALVATPSSSAPNASGSTSVTAQAASDDAPPAFPSSTEQPLTASTALPAPSNDRSADEANRTAPEEQAVAFSAPVQTNNNNALEAKAPLAEATTAHHKTSMASNNAPLASTDADESTPDVPQIDRSLLKVDHAVQNIRPTTATDLNTTIDATTAADEKVLTFLAPATWSNSLTATDPIIELKKATVQAPFQPQHYIGGRLGVGANSATGMGRANIGYSAGLTYEREFSSRWSFKVGLASNIKRYDRNDLFSIEDAEGREYEVSQSKTTHLVLLEVPVDAQYTLFRSDKWRLYLAAGLSFNAIGSRTYAGTQEVEDGPLSFQLDLNSADFERGLFEGGTFSDNAYLSAGAGFGVERQLGNQLSLYLLPTYRHAITAAGGDYIHAFDVHIGIKTPIAISKR